AGGLHQRGGKKLWHQRSRAVVGIGRKLGTKADRPLAKGAVTLSARPWLTTATRERSPPFFPAKAPQLACRCARRQRALPRERHPQDNAAASCSSASCAFARS